jgi:hypothetical protein
MTIIAPNKVTPNKVTFNKVAPNKVTLNSVAPQTNRQLNDNICIYCKKVGHCVTRVFKIKIGINY